MKENILHSLFLILFQPSEVLDDITESVGTFFSSALAFLGVFHLLFTLQVITIIESEWISTRLMLLDLLFSIIISSLLLVFGAYFLSSTSKWFGGESDEEKTRILIGFSFTPLAFLSLFDVLILIAFHYVEADNLFFLRTALGFITFIAVQWALLILLKSHSALNKLVLTKAILSALTVIILPIISFVMIYSFFDAAQSESGRTRVDILTHLKELRWLIVVIGILVINSRWYQFLLWKYVKSKKKYYIVRNDGHGWLVRKGGTALPIAHYKTKHEAIEYVESVRHLFSEELKEDDAVRSNIKDAIA